MKHVGERWSSCNIVPNQQHEYQTSLEASARKTTTQINIAELSQCSLEFVNAASYPDTCKSRQGATEKKSEEDSTTWRLLQEDV
ncbi:unnamed protein product [Sphagnum jensenii]|uniref:Uncharacterized protein n=1 Tax=Sphagnum jensenii TaxID=128206 RepID=A0ABP1BIR7_9BRYO